MAIQAKPDPTNEAKVLKKKHQVPNSPIQVNSCQVSSQPQLHPKKVKSRRKIDRAGLLKKCRSQVEDNEYDTVIIEEEYLPGSRRNSPHKTVRPMKVFSDVDKGKETARVGKAPKIAIERNSIVKIDGEIGFNRPSGSRKSKDDSWNYVVEKPDSCKGLSI